MTKRKVTDGTIVRELKDFRSKLTEYWFLLLLISQAQNALEDDQAYNKRLASLWTGFEPLRTGLQESYGKLRGIIEGHAGRPVLVDPSTNSEMKVSVVGLAFAHLPPHKDAALAVQEIILRTNLAIGSLRSSSGPPWGEATRSPRVFIAQGGPSSALDKLTKFLDALGVKPVIAQDQPSEGKSVDQQVERCLDECDCAIVLATKGDRDGRTKARIPRGNVLHEIGMCQKKFPARVIYLKEKGVEFPSNIREKVRESFTSDHMDEAFTKVAKELRAFGLIGNVMPLE